MVTWIEAIQHFGAVESILVNYLVPIIAIFIASISKDEKLQILCIGSGITCYAIVFNSTEKDRDG
jgi:drug/metabolite transporter (DMT)-like permease